MRIRRYDHAADFDAIRDWISDERAYAHAFDETGAATVRLSVFPENVGALRCYEGVGFTALREEPGAFRYRDEVWSRRSMAIDKGIF